MDTHSPCSSVNEAEYAEMIEHRAIELYKILPNAKPLLNSNNSPGKNRLDTTKKKGKAYAKKCPGVDLAARRDAAILIQRLMAKTPGSGT